MIYGLTSIGLMTGYAAGGCLGDCLLAAGGTMLVLLILMWVLELVLIALE